MNRKNLHKRLESLNHSLSKENIPLVYESIDLFSPLINEFRNDPNNLLDNGNAGNNRRNNIVSSIKQIISKEKGLKYRNIIIQAARLEDELQLAKTHIEETNRYYAKFIYEIEEKLEGFLSHYERHTRAYSSSSCISLSIWASDLKTAITSTQKVLDGVLNLTSVVEKEHTDEYSKLDLYLSNVVDLKDFAIKLEAISEIYSELLSLYGLSESDSPIIIEHLESGSLWIKIAGHTLTATLFTSLLTSATTYYQENYTTTGQLNQLPTSVKVADDLLKLSQQLEKDGIDTTEIKENIESATRKISKKLDVLLGDQPIVEINDVEHSVGAALNQKLIEESKTFKLEHQDDS
ncbi:MAG: hypothetical protein ACRBB6_01850 [Neptuniibacter sp.]